MNATTRFIDDLLKLLAPAYLPGALALLAFGYWLRYNHRIFFGARKEGEGPDFLDNDLQERRRWIEQCTFEQRYLGLLGRGLDAVAERFARDAWSLGITPVVPGWTGRLFGLDPFTEGSYTLCLRLALVYPLLGFFVVWLLDGGGAFSGLPLLP